MSETLKIALTAVGGVTVFVIGQMAVKFLIEPIYEQKKLIGEIAATIIFYSNVGAGVEQYYYDRIKAIDATVDARKDIIIDRYKDILNSHWAKSDEAARTLRLQATELLARTNAIPFYRLWAFFGCVPKLADIMACSTELIGMSNSTHTESSSLDSRIKEIIVRLRLKTLAKHRGL
jgi:hypothetical protein